MSERTFEVDDTEPIIGEILHGPFANPSINAILKKFGKRAFARTSMCMEFESFLRRIGAEKIGGTCLEIGSYNGITAVILAQFFERVVCVSLDIDTRQIIRPEIVDYLGIKNIEFHACESNGMKAKIVNRLAFDFCYSDGDHTHDARSDFGLVKRCGRVLFHEYWPIQPPVWNLVNSLPQEEVTRAQFDCLAYWQRADLAE